MSGTVNIARSLFQDEAFKAQPYTEREAFMWLVMEASWKDRTKRVGNSIVELKRGQLAASIRFMAEAWDWEKSTVDRFLKRLEKRDMIGTESGTGVSVVTIYKYNDYQGGNTASGTAELEKRDSSGTAAGQTRTPEAIPEAIHKEERPEGLAQAPKPASFLADLASPESIASFMAYRSKTKRAALTATAAKRMATHLREIFDGGGDPSEALAMAEERGWLTVEPEWYFNAKVKNGKSNRGQSPQSSAFDEIAFAARAR